MCKLKYFVLWMPSKRHWASWLRSCVCALYVTAQMFHTSDNRKTIILLWLVCADIDDCAPGGQAEKCSEHGTCDGANPPGGFTCFCAAGYKLKPDKKSCEGMTFSITAGTFIICSSRQYVYTRSSARQRDQRGSYAFVVAQLISLSVILCLLPLPNTYF